MNALQVDPKTGFLESRNPSGYTFTAEKKVQFLELAAGERAAGRFPNLSNLCDVVGVNMLTVDRHLTQDSAFKSAWDEIVLRVESQCMSDMYDMRLKQPLFMFSLLRRLLPNRWNPDSKLNVTVEHSGISALFDKSKAVEAEACPASAPQLNELPSERHILEKDKP